MAIIGDSDIEALQVQNSDSMHGILANVSSSNIFSLGFSGAPLSTYLAYAKFAEKQLNPGTYCFVIISNDFVESFSKPVTSIL